MSRITKIVYFSILFIIAIGQLVAGNPTLGLGLVLLLIFAIQWFEKREARRQFYRALRKLYICVDSHAYGIEMEKLKRDRLVKKYSATSLQLLEAISLYYQDKRVESKMLLLQIEATKDFSFWKHCYLILIQLNNNLEKSNNIERNLELLSLYENAASEIKQVPNFFRDISEQRLAVLDLMLKENLEIVEIEHMRDLVKCNLLMAELTKLMVIHASDERIRKYYQKGFINLSKGLTI